MHHQCVAWDRRDRRNVLLVHYDDLSRDLAAEMRRIAYRLRIGVPPDTWPVLVQAATFDHMRASAHETVPDPSGVLKDESAFYRQGTSGGGRQLLSDDEYAAYQERVAKMAPPDLLLWLHHDP